MKAPATPGFRLSRYQYSDKMGACRKLLAGTLQPHFPDETPSRVPWSVPGLGSRPDLLNWRSFSMHQGVMRLGAVSFIWTESLHREVYVGPGFNCAHAL